MKTKVTFGTCVYDSMSPKREDLDKNSKYVNLNMSYKEALIFKENLQACISHLQKYDRRTKEGMEAGLTLMVQLETLRVGIRER